jgi:hypothetical protein
VHVKAEQRYNHIKLRKAEFKNRQHVRKAVMKKEVLEEAENWEYEIWGLLMENL